MRSNKAAVTLFITTILFSLSACSNTDTNNTTKTITKFGVDKNTLSKLDEQIKLSELTESEVIEYHKEKDKLAEKSYYASEIKIENEDNSVSYEVDGEDIVYKGRRFIGLNKCIDSIDYPYTRETMTNFLIKSFDNNTDDVECFYINNHENIETGEEDTDTTIPLSDSMRELQGYSEIADKYNEDVYWILEMSTNRTKGMIYGCSKYILIRNKDGLIVDMSTLEDFRLVDEEEQTESSEEENQTQASEQTSHVEVETGAGK